MEVGPLLAGCDADPAFRLYALNRQVEQARHYFLRRASLRMAGGVGGSGPIDIGKEALAGRGRRHLTGMCHCRANFIVRMTGVCTAEYPSLGPRIALFSRSFHPLACIADKSLEICQRCRLKQQNSPAGPENSAAVLLRPGGTRDSSPAICRRVGRHRDLRPGVARHADTPTRPHPDTCSLPPVSAQKRQTLTHIGLGILHRAFRGKHSAVVRRLQISEERFEVVAPGSGIEAAGVGKMNM
jgi:hypothetical protein